MVEPTFHIKVETEKPGFGKFIIEPLEQGYGQTLGNSVRRVLLSSLPGAAISSVKIEGVKHQFSALVGMKEDVVEFIMNLKKVRLTIDGSDTVKMTISKKGSGEVLAGDIDVPSGVTIVNPDLVLANLADKKAVLEVEMNADKGYGYISADEKHFNEVGVMPMDSLYSPVTRVNYRVEATRVGRMTNLDRLVMEIWTDGTVSASDALKSSAKVLVSYFMQVVEPKAQGLAESVAVTPAISDEVLKMRIEELDIPTRIVNALANGGIETIGQLLGTPPADLMKIKNLGIKSLGIVEEKLREKGVALAV
ncbi:DNA-directed RNA polymerase subunit alpha [Candidatus Gottesmanbacteria bacterium RIFCSPLOWO2_01_FULL_46_9]|uniref:DNA-directed RNA polymerase subunit alpha n=1 Tax=Candidatus Gottesmanbacteria bacterium RIFCSPLOWO2_01_FULL_46_9 TaxID=1798394 RepID=A0A1F6B3E8_9BACT|nr:MAG: DNA-directed RNA polymerase subunit alpha [Candidatus Gottesmanbacteria bacterium RIFCSPLOWO2_01_FULL_46_9]